MNTPAPQLFFSNLFTILSFEKGANLYKKNSVLKAAGELGVHQKGLSEIFAGWKASGKKVFLTKSQNDNKELIYSLCAALLEDSGINSDSLNYFYSLAERIGVTRSALKQVIDGRSRFVSEKSFIKRGDIIKKSVEAGSIRGSASPGRPRRNNDFYIANQVTYEGLDELQRLLLAHHLGCHVAIDGPPGVGKTKSVIEVSRILGKNLYTKTCSNRTTESHIISHPILTVQEGVSVTHHVNGPLCLAMEEPGVFYGDEFNLLKEDVQKRLNSAFDERRYIDRNDGAQVEARPGFWAVISYNPTRNLVARDLEDSVADRFIHFNYNRWPSDFKAYVSSKTAEGKSPLEKDETERYNITLGWRGISDGDSFFYGDTEDGVIKWRDFFTGKAVNVKPAYIYRVYDRGSILRNRKKENAESLEKLARQSFAPVELSRIMSSFTDLLQSLSRTGKSPLLTKIGMENILEDEDMELLGIHESSTRIEIAALRHYHELISRGFNRYLAQAYAAKLIIDQICYGQYRTKKLRNATAYSLVRQIAGGMRLLVDSKNFNTSFDIEGLLKK